MARPAGFSSDEDDFDPFDDEDLDGPPLLAQRNVNLVDERERNLSNLFFSIMRGNIEEVRQLLNEGLDVNITLRDNWNPMVLAASVGEAEIVQELIAKGGDVNSNRDKYTALMAACSCPLATAPYERSAEVARLLIENGANVNAISRKRMTAFMYAASSGNVEIVRMLLPLCDKHAEDNQGWTALFWAVNDNCPEVVKILLEEGLNPEKIDIRNNVPLHYAISQDFDEIVKLLPSKQSQNKDEVFKNCSYIFEEEFKNFRKNESPRFFRDIHIMLYGMKCEQLSNILAEKNVDLLTFVSLNENRLKDLGILLPYQRNKILAGLHKFHKHPYRPKSIPIVPKNEIYSTIDVANAVFSALRQITTMEGALTYVESEMTQPIYDTHIEKRIELIRSKIKSIKRVTAALSKKAEKWDEMIKPADLITKDSLRKRRFHGRWMIILGGVTLTFIIIKRNWFVRLKLF